MDIVNGFSKKTKHQKRLWLQETLKKHGTELNIDFDMFNAHSMDHQETLDEFSENTIANFALPYGLAPNFKINEKLYTIPMVCEESSVVAAASHSAKFWLSRGGFQAEVVDNIKLGHVHFLFEGKPHDLEKVIKENMSSWRHELYELEKSMVKRGGGIVSIDLQNLTHQKTSYYTLELKAKTCDAMGANFLNTILEKLGELLQARCPRAQVLMCILSNYTTQSLVKARVQCHKSELAHILGNEQNFAERFIEAIEIARVNPQRAVTHNKGIMNGVDSVIIATGNDFRAVEACAHAYAARDGQYRSLTRAWLEEDQFIFELELPLALGTIGGVTSLHPMAKASLEILGHPSAEELMKITACMGLAQNFSAIRSLVTCGIQQGHMKMHFLNILKSLDVNEYEQEQCKKFFSDKVISVKSVREYLYQLRTMH